jgi:DNA-binding response OmpR family regulator
VPFHPDRHRRGAASFVLGEPRGGARPIGDLGMRFAHPYRTSTPKLTRSEAAMPTVHLADTDRIFRHALQRYLEALDYKVVTASELAVIGGSCPGCRAGAADVAVLGLNLRSEDLSVALARLRRLDAAMPVMVLLTNPAPATLALLLAEPNVSSVLTKPILLSHVEATLAGVLNEARGGARITPARPARRAADPWSAGVVAS